MPPSRRRPPPSSGAVPPVRRPRVAGLRNRSAAARQTESERESISGELEVPDAESTEPGETTRSADATETAAQADRDHERDHDEAGIGRVSETGTLGAPRSEPDDLAPESGYADTADDRDDRDDRDDLDDLDDLDDEYEQRPTPTRRPAGKRRAAGVARPADLEAAEADTADRAGARHAARPARTAREKASRRLSVAVVLVVVAVVLAGLAVWFRGEVTDLESADSNTALTDPAASSEALGQLKTAVEDTFSYNHTDLERTTQAVDRVLTGEARCEYDQLFGQVKELGPKQKLVVVTLVREIALVRLDGNRAEALVYIDQTSTRGDKNSSLSGEGHFSVVAERSGEEWKIVDINMLEQSFVNGKPVPGC